MAENMKEQMPGPQGLVERIEAALGIVDETRRQVRERAPHLGALLGDMAELLRSCKASMEWKPLERGSEDGHETIVLYRRAVELGLNAVKGCIEIGEYRMAIANLNGMLDQITPAPSGENSNDQ